MAKTNISFNNQDYQIDPASLSEATAELRQHLSSVMNGSGATIDFGGTTYNIDSTKLSTATNAFVTHLGTIAGSGYKVKVGEVEYGISSDKVAGAVSELEAVLGGLNNPDAPSGEERLEGDGQEFHKFAPAALTFRSTAPLNELQEVQINGVTVDPSNYTTEEGSTIVTLPIEYLNTLDVDNYEITVVSDSMSAKGGFTVVEPQLNEHGFYYNQPYSANLPMFGGDTAFFVREDGTYDIITVGKTPDTGNYTMSGNNIVATHPMLGTITCTISSDGTEVFCNELQVAFKLSNSTSIAADEDYVYVYMEDFGGDGGYEVICIDKTKTEYGAIKTGINGIDTLAIGERAFNNCTNLTSIVIPSCIIGVFNGAFSGCISLDEVIFENCQVYYDREYAFPDSPLTKGISIRHSYFKNDYVCDICGHCEHLHTEVVNKTDDYSGDIVCKDCGKTLTSGTYRIPVGATYYISSTGETLSEGDWFPSRMQKGDQYTYGQYEYTLYIAGATTYWNFKVIDKTLYEYDVWLEEINGLRVISRISSHAFENCDSFTSITIPNGVTAIESYAFWDCDSLTSITIPNGVTAIGMGAFEHCGSLTSITIPDSVTIISDSVFKDCQDLISITFNGTTAQWDAITKGDYWNYRVPATYVQCSDGQVAL